MRVAVDTASLDEVKVAVEVGLKAYNDRFLPKDRDRVPFAVSVRDNTGAVVGGLVGEFRLDWIHIDNLWVDESLRGEGYGRELLAVAEREASAAGATHIVLWTWSFQAPAFYAAQGFTECGRITDHPKGHDTILFVKRLT